MPSSSSPTGPRPGELESLWEKAWICLFSHSSPDDHHTFHHWLNHFSNSPHWQFIAYRSQLRCQIQRLSRIPFPGNRNGVMMHSSCSLQGLCSLWPFIVSFCLSHFIFYFQLPFSVHFMSNLRLLLTWCILLLSHSFRYLTAGRITNTFFKLFLIKYSHLYLSWNTSPVSFCLSWIDQLCPSLEVSRVNGRT